MTLSLISFLSFETYLDGSSGDMAVVRKSCSEGRAIIECVEGLALGELELLLECVDLLPILEHFLFLLGEVRSLGNYKSNEFRG
jgi:hypothetical protein